MNPNELAALPDALATQLLESFASKPELLPQSPDDVTWDTPGVGSITIEEFQKRIAAAIKEAMQAQRKRDAEICRNVYPKRHTFASENADIYSAQDQAAAKCAAAIEREPI